MLLQGICTIGSIYPHHEIKKSEEHVNFFFFPFFIVLRHRIYNLSSSPSSSSSSSSSCSFVSCPYQVGLMRHNPIYGLAKLGNFLRNLVMTLNKQKMQKNLLLQFVQPPHSRSTALLVDYKYQILLLVFIDQFRNNFIYTYIYR